MSNHTFITPSFGDEYSEPIGHQTTWLHPNTTSSGSNSTGGQMTTDNPIYNSDDNNSTPDADEKKKKMKRDPNEPTKPVSAYALFFRDTVSAIKAENPEVSFSEISKIVASMWDALDIEHKNVYKKKNEVAKKEYLKALHAYRLQKHINSNGVTEGTCKPVLFTLRGSTSQSSHTSPFTSPLTSPQSGTLSNASFVSPTHNMMQSPPSLQMNFNELKQELSHIPTETGGSAQKCIREGCLNGAVINQDWEDEYCCNECVVQHCRNVFNNWVQQNLQQNAQQQTAFTV